MSKYFYHGIEFYPGVVGSAAEIMLRILNEGILTRNRAHRYNDSNLEHVCLYQRNDEYDYEGVDSCLNSARGAWMDHNFFFVINPNINARKAILGEETDLVDEWRYDGNISPDDIVGIALPYKNIEYYLNEDYEEDIEDKKLFRSSFSEIMKIVEERHLQVFDSDQDGITDIIDATLGMGGKGPKK